jgi:AbrB family looped-hinge helix DNA binding protein
MVELQLRARLGPKCQAVIPKPVREALHVGPGDEIVFRVRDQQIILERKSGQEIMEEFLNAVPRSARVHGVNLKRRYYEQIDKRMRRAGV